MYSLHLWLCITFCVAQATIGEGAEHWFQYQCRTYFVDTNFNGNYFAARDFCKGKRMDLVTLENKDIDSTVILELKKIVGSQTRSFWTSGNRLADDQTWVWTTSGKKITEFNWGAGEPNNIGSQSKCIHLYLSGSTVFWDDKDCSFQTGAVCQSQI